MTRRIWTGIFLSFFGLLVAIGGPVWVTQASPVVTYPLCKGDIALLSLCDASAHTVRGMWLVALVLLIVGGIMIAITGWIMAATKAK